MDNKLIRNFSIIAHIDHGKSTLADRLLEFTGTLTSREMTEQVLDQMDLERERGITIKLQAVRINYCAKDGNKYVLNLIDTPGHVDFAYEVSRSLAACEGALLVVDATQGIEAQTLANLYMALDHNLEIIPIINKIDLPSADPQGVQKQIEEILGLEGQNAIFASAKTGEGIEEILEAIIRFIPPPRRDTGGPLRALVFDSHFDSYRGAVPYVRVVEGRLRKGLSITMMASNKTFEVNEVGVFTPVPQPVGELAAGEVGYFTASIKNVKDTRVGETVTDARKPAEEPLPGYRPAKSMVFCGFYPVNSDEYNSLRDALDRLHLNDAAFSFDPETSVALGFGFRCGFLGLLHMEIIQERIEREYGINLITTAPNVVFHVHQTNGEVLEIDNPSALPATTKVIKIEEPYVEAMVLVPPEYIGPVMELAQDRRAIFKGMEYLGSTRVTLTYHIPLGEIIYDFFDQLKSRTKGYASLDYQLVGYWESELVRLDILVNNELVDSLSVIVHRDKAFRQGRALVEKLRQLIPRQLFEIPIQAAIGGKIIARESVHALRKNVLEKCYGGDVSRKRKLLEKQKEGKKRMKQVGSVQIPQEAFMAVLKVDR